MVVAQRGFINEIIDLEETSKLLCNDRTILRNKQQMHVYQKKIACHCNNLFACLPTNILYTTFAKCNSFPCRVVI